MNAEESGAAPESADAARDARAKRKFLVVVDDTPECKVAIRYAGRRAQSTGGSLLLLRVVDPRAEHTHWISVEERMRDEALAEAEELLQNLASEINDWAGLFPAVTIREGQLQEQVLAQIKAEPGISVLVLAAAPGNEGPGPLVSALAGSMSGAMRIPVTVVPGDMTDKEVDRLS